MVFCAWHFAVYALLLVGVYGLFHTLVNQRFTEAFFSLDDLLQYQTALAAEDYGAIPLRGEGNASFLIFDEEGRTVYASNRSIGEKVFFQDLDMLDDYHAGKLLDVFREETAVGETRYTVYLSAYAGGKAPQRLASCVLDGDYRILSGDLFAGREALTPGSLTCSAASPRPTAWRRSTPTRPTTARGGPWCSSPPRWGSGPMSGPSTGPTSRGWRGCPASC